MYGDVSPAGRTFGVRARSARITIVSLTSTRTSLSERTPTLEHQQPNTNTRTPTLEHQHSNTNTRTQVRFKPSIRHPIKIRSRSSISECVRVHLRSPDLIARTRTIRVNVLEVRIRVERIDSTRVNPSYRSDTVSRTQVSPTRCRLRPHRFHSSPWIT